MIKKCVILCGGLGTRFSEETYLKPKPMIEIGGKPILWHIMKYYSSFGINEFILCLGYKSWVIKEYFLNYYKLNSNFTIDLQNNDLVIEKPTTEKWKVALIDTGLNTMTGSRLNKIKKYLNQDQNFFCTYGDGLSDININKLLKLHLKHPKIATVSAVRNPGRFGSLNIKNNFVKEFIEKPIGDNSWINGGFFVFNHKIFDYIPKGNQVVLEKDVLPKIANKNQLNAYLHRGFWRPMDTKRDYESLEIIYKKKQCPWKTW